MPAIIRRDDTIEPLYPEEINSPEENVEQINEDTGSDTIIEEEPVGEIAAESLPSDLVYETDFAPEEIEAEGAPLAANENDGAPLAPNNVNEAPLAGDSCIFWWKQKFNVYGSLYWDLENNPDDTFSVKAVYQPTTSDITSFTYEGQTLSEIAVAAYREKTMPDIMITLLKLGDELKYGEALYETGIIPEDDGEPYIWDKYYYDEMVNYIGKDLLDKYIIDGEFLSEELEKDISEYSCNDQNEKYELAFSAYMDTIIPDIVSGLCESGIECSRDDRTNNAIIMTVTADQLENIPLDDIKYWYFSSNTSSQDTVQTSDAVYPVNA